MFICLVYSHFIIFDLNLFFPLECSSGDLGNPLGIPRMPSMHSNRGGIATQRRGSQGDRLPNVQTCTKYERDSKRFKENTIYLIYLIYDQPLHQGNSVFELSCFSVPINSMPVSLTGLDSESKTQIASSKGPQLFQLRGKHW